MRTAFEQSGAGHTLDQVSVERLDEESGAAVAAAALAAGDLPDAFVCANDELALGLLGRLRAAGHRRPRHRHGDRAGTT